MDNKYMKKYMKKYWKENPDKYKIHIKRMKKKYYTKHGKEVHEKAVKRFNKKHPNYHAHYCMKMRINRLKKDLCTRCGQSIPRYKLCDDCRNTHIRTTAKKKNINKILNLLIKNADLTYSQIRKKTGFPTTTIYDYVKEIKKDYEIKRIIIPRERK